MKRLQDYAFDKSHYERSCQKKICGWTVFGKACQIGPDKHGNCQAQYECVPFKKGDRWVCTRPPSSGGKCTAGPTAEGVCCNKIPRCVPLDSMRQRRGKFVIWFTVLVLSTIVFFLTAPFSSSVISPGELTSKHQQEGGECQLCHLVDGKNVGDWLATAFADVSVHQVNMKCEACHDFGFDKSSPHSQDPAIMQALSDKQATQERTIFSLLPDGVNSESVATSHVGCVSCHQEHKGRDFDMTQMDNAQCVSCHKSQHVGFAQDHPDFHDYPYQRRQRIIFDHAAHIKDYFTKKKLLVYAPKTCVACHQAEPESGGRYMVAKGFEQSCVACHGKDVTGEKLESKGFPVFGLPAIDTESLSASNLAIGQWPADMEDEEMPGIMLFLLSVDNSLHPVLDAIARSEIELSDLSDSTDEERQQVAALVWSIKQFLFDLVTRGTPALIDRFQKASGLGKNGVNRYDLAGKLPIDLVTNMQRRWFPALVAEMKQYRQGIQKKTQLIDHAAIYVDDVQAEEWAKSGGWYLQDFSLFYRPQGHADTMIRSWIDISALAYSSSLLAQMSFYQLSDSKLPGQCGKCHSVDMNDGEPLVNWRGKHSQSGETLFTKFNHKAHFSLLDGRGCEKCHQIDLQADVEKNYQPGFEGSLITGWHQLEKSTCSECHKPEGAGERCTLCHNYHVGHFEVITPGTSLQVMVGEENSQENGVEASE